MSGTGPSRARATPALAVAGLKKRFGATRALRGVDFDLRRGEVHALCGENGAGKSTLVRILAGIHPPDAGTLSSAGRQVKITGPAASRALGIAVIHQEFDLAPNLSVAENLLLGREPRKWRWLIDPREQRRRARRALGRVGLHLDPALRTSELTAAQRQLVAIARALMLHARILIMDEPTSALAAGDIESLLKLIRRLRDGGAAVLFISHKLDEVFAIADRITVLRDGRGVGAWTRRETSRDEVVARMVGRELEGNLSRDPRRAEDEVLELRGFGLSGAFRDVSLVLGKGEILGIYGLQGAGRSALAAALFGLRPADTGRCLVRGREVRLRSPRDAMRHGLAMVPEDRNVQGLFANLGVRENLTLATVDNLSRAGVISRGREQAVARAAAARFGIRTADLEQPITELSGGNQQKVLLARWLIGEPKVLILDEPTAGVDVGAKSEIYAILDGLTRNGIGILLITSELPELLGLCDRVLVMAEGRLVGEFDHAAASEEKIMHAIQAG